MRDFRLEGDVAIMTVRDLTRHHMDVVINNLNNNFNANVSVPNWSQLGFALNKPACRFAAGRCIQRCAKRPPS